MAKTRIPDSELVKRVIYQTLKDHGIVHTQEELAEIVESELKRLDDQYQISPQRARRIALEVSGLRVDTETREGDEPPDNCPVCGEELEETVATNLRGENVVVGKDCTTCDYEADMKQFTPRRYEFKILKQEE